MKLYSKQFICSVNLVELQKLCMHSIHSNGRLPGEYLFPQQALFHLQLYHLAPRWHIHLQEKNIIMLAVENMAKTQQAGSKYRGKKQMRINL